MSEKNKELRRVQNDKKDDLDDELKKQWEMQDQIHKACKMKGDIEERQKKWKEKYG